MEAQLQRPTRGLHYEEDPHNAGEGVRNHQGEKKSVLKKVKEKAKKIKDTIKKHGHGQGGEEHEHEYHQGHISEEEDDDEDGEMVNDPEIHGAPIYESSVITGTNLPTQTVVNLEKSSDPREDRYSNDIRSEVYPIVEDEGVNRPAGRVKLGADWGSYDPNVRTEEYPMVEDGRVSGSSGSERTGTQMRTGCGVNVKNEEYPKVEDKGVTTSPSGPEKMRTELGMSTVEAREPEFKIPIQSSPNPVDVEEANVVGPMVRIGPLVDLEEDPHSPKRRPGEIPPSNYQAKVVDPTGEGGKEADVAPLVERLDNLHVHDESESKPKSEQRVYTGSHDQFAPQSTPTEDEFNPESNPISLSEMPKSFDPANPESMPRDTVAGKISSATSAMVDKAAAAKNVVASKLGYGCQHQEGEDSFKKPASESATEYAHKVAEKLAPVYEKVVGAGSTILSKVHRGREVEQERDGQKVATGTDKGVSVKEYLVEKCSPGEEDKALSKVIAEALHKKKEGMRRRTGEADAAASLCTRSENKREGEEDAAAAGGGSSAGGAVDRLKGAVGSWLGKSTGRQAAEHVGQSNEEVSGQQRRLQESGD